MQTRQRKETSTRRSFIPVLLFKRDRPRDIDRVIDYFGGVDPLADLKGSEVLLLTGTGTPR